MIEQPFLYALGKVLYSVTVIEGEMEPAESELLRDEVFRCLGPLLAPEAKPLAWKAMFQFPIESASKGMREHLAAALQESLLALEPDMRRPIKSACQGMLVEMTKAFGNHDQDTRTFLGTLLTILADEAL